MKILKATEKEIDSLMAIRLEMLREVNGLSDSYEYDNSFIENCRKNFMEGNQTDILCFENEIPIA